MDGMNLLPRDLSACMAQLPTEKAEEYAPLLGDAMTEGDITAPYRAAAFLSQLAHESVNLIAWKEYGGEHRAYAPWYGRGPIQVTHRYNYEACGKALMLDLIAEPDLLLQPGPGFRSAVWYWRTCALNAVSDRLETEGRAAYDEITYRINGRGATQLSRDSRWFLYGRVLTVMSTPTVVIT